MKPAEMPRRRPAKMIGAAAGSTILRMISVRVPRKALPISIIDADVLRTPPEVLSTITGMAMMQTTNTFDVRPMP